MPVVLYSHRVRLRTISSVARLIIARISTRAVSNKSVIGLAVWIAASPRDGLEFLVEAELVRRETQRVLSGKPLVSLFTYPVLTDSLTGLVALFSEPSDVPLSSS